MTSKDVVRSSTLVARDLQMETVSFHFLLPAGAQVTIYNKCPQRCAEFGALWIGGQIVKWCCYFRSIWLVFKFFKHRVSM